MAKYEDYVNVNSTEDVDEELQDAQSNQQHRESNDDDFEVPERFKGKSAEEIARSYVELERHSSRRESEYDRTRRLADELITMESQRLRLQEQEREQEDSVSVSADDFYDNPEDAVTKIVDKRYQPKIEGLERQLNEQTLQTKVAEFSNRFPKWKEDAQSSGFAEFVQGSPYRQRLASKADEYDLDAAEELFSIYYELRDSRKANNDREREQALDESGLERGGPEQYEREEVYKRSDLLGKRVAANRGDREAAQWLQENAESIAIAYEEGRVVD